MLTGGLGVPDVAVMSPDLPVPSIKGSDIIPFVNVLQEANVLLDTNFAENVYLVLVRETLCRIFPLQIRLVSLTAKMV